MILNEQKWKEIIKKEELTVTCKKLRPRARVVKWCECLSEDLSGVIESDWLVAKKGWGKGEGDRDRERGIK